MVIAGRHERGSRALLTRYREEAGLTLMSAAHGLLESVSAIRRFVHRESITPHAGGTAVTQLGSLPLALDATEARLPRIWALRDRMSPYDAAYAAVAEAFESPLLTVDARLLRACLDAGIPATHLDDLAA